MSAAVSISPGSLLEAPHHDGSPRYQPNPPQEHGDRFTVLLRTSAARAPNYVTVRQVIDGEALEVAAEVVARDPHQAWWQAELTAANSPTHYRFRTDLGPHRYRWHTAAGACDSDLPDASDFRVAIGDHPPAWLSDAVAYQIFPDRFARAGGPAQTLPSWAIPAAWDDDPDLGPGIMGRQFYGGNLPGITAHLDHIAALGANLIYLTPIFPAESNHRYNATTFASIDPLLGGEPALRELLDAAHARGIRVIGDLTTNHTGSGHEWFRAARAGHSPESEFYYFDGSGGYTGWLGHPSLPKLNHASTVLRGRLVSGPDSVAARWLAFGLDGWRVDVANMTGRFGQADHNATVARAMRATMAAVKPDSYLVAEHFYDAMGDLDGTTWHGVMNYAGFALPVWTWLTPPEHPDLAPRWRLPRLPGTAVAAAMQAFTALPWSAQIAHLNLVGSHDTPRVQTLLENAEMVELALVAMFTYPGIPMIYSGDEMGYTGTSGEAGRRPINWDDPAARHNRTQQLLSTLTAIRRDSCALRRGGLRWAYADEDRLAWLREDAQESVLVFLARASGAPVQLSAGLLGLAEDQEAANLFGGAALTARHGLAQLPGAGPTAQIWRLPTVG